MIIYCTRPRCPNPENDVLEFENSTDSGIELYCSACRMPLILTGKKGRYQPFKPLGKGGFAETFLAIDLDSLNQRQCVVKQLEIQANHNPEIVDGIKIAFEREAKVLEKLGERSGNIPSLYDYFSLTVPDPSLNTQQELNYLVQQYIEGQDLSKELEQKVRFSEAEIVAILNNILPVLEFIHQENVIHRDIKPSNMVREAGKENFYLIDFGAVKQVMTGMTSSGKSIVFGTPGYAPPEQIAEKEVDPSSDLYALAASCVQLLTGQPPSDFRDPDNRNWRQKYPHLSESLVEILDRMLRPHPDARFQSAREVITALNESEVTKEPNNNNYLQSSDATIVITRSKYKILVKIAIALTIIGVLITQVLPRIKIGELQPSIPILPYEDTTSGMQINYPENWELKKQEPSPITGWIIAQIVPKPASVSPQWPEVLISIEELSEPTTLEDYTQLATQQIQNSAQDVKILKSQGIKLNNQEGYQVIYTGKDTFYNFNFKAEQIWFIDSQKAYIITYRAEEKLYDEFIKPVDEIIIKSFVIP